MATVTTRAARIFALPVEEQLMLLLTLVVVAHVRLALSVLPSRVSLRLVRRLAETTPIETRVPRIPPAHVAWAVEAVSRFVPRATCLTQAVACQLLLRRYGYASKLCLGVVRPSQEEFYAHAWVERDGAILIGGRQSTVFTRLPSLTSTIRHKRRPDTR